MEETRYGLRVEIPITYERSVEQATAALKESSAPAIRRLPTARSTPSWRSDSFCPATFSCTKCHLAGVLCRPWRRWRRSASSGTTRNSSMELP